MTNKTKQWSEGNEFYKMETVKWLLKKDHSMDSLDISLVDVKNDSMDSSMFEIAHQIGN